MKRGAELFKAAFFGSRSPAGAEPSVLVEALSAYEKALESSPNRLNSLY